MPSDHAHMRRSSQSHDLQVQLLHTVVISLYHLEYLLPADTRTGSIRPTAVNPCHGIPCKSDYKARVRHCNVDVDACKRATITRNLETVSPPTARSICPHRQKMELQESALSSTSFTWQAPVAMITHIECIEHIPKRFQCINCQRALVPAHCFSAAPSEG